MALNYSKEEIVQKTEQILSGYIETEALETAVKDIENNKAELESLVEENKLVISTPEQVQNHIEFQKELLKNLREALEYRVDHRGAKE